MALPNSRYPECTRKTTASSFDLERGPKEFDQDNQGLYNPADLDLLQDNFTVIHIGTAGRVAVPICMVL